MKCTLMLSDGSISHITINTLNEDNAYEECELAAYEITGQPAQEIIIGEVE